MTWRLVGLSTIWGLATVLLVVAVQAVAGHIYLREDLLGAVVGVGFFAITGVVAASMQNMSLEVAARSAQLTYVLKACVFAIAAFALVAPPHFSRQSFGASAGLAACVYVLTQSVGLARTTGARESSDQTPGMGAHSHQSQASFGPLK